MKINYLILENFSNIETSMNTNRVKIDFTKATNRVILLVGRNGSGKTSILSMLTPFADVGGLDVRKSSHLVIEGRDGYKEIQIQKDDSVYTIKHYYTSKKGGGHTIKSYIEKDGIELNPNGNVTSFKEWVSVELGVEPDYLKLIRLGANVTSMISMTETERKAFMNKLLEEADTFLAFHKKVRADLTQVKLMIGHVTDKKKRLGVTDINQLLDLEADSKKALKHLESEREDVSRLHHVSEATLARLGDRDDIVARLKAVNDTFRRLEKVRTKKEYSFDDVEDYVSAISTQQALIASKEATIQSSRERMNFVNENLNSLTERYHELETALSKENAIDREIRLLEEELERLCSQCTKIEKTLPDKRPSVTKEELDSFIIFLKSVSDRMSTTYEFGRSIMAKLISLMREGVNVQTYVDKKLSQLTPASKVDMFLERLNREYIAGCKLDCDNKNCPAHKVFTQLANMLETSDVIVDSDQLDEVALTSLASSYRNITQILSEFAAYSTTINKLPKHVQKDFIVRAVYDRIETCSPIYDVQKMNELYSIVVEFSVKDELEKKIQETSDKLIGYQGQSPSTVVAEQMGFVRSEIQSCNDEKASIKRTIMEAREAIEECRRSLDVYTEEYEALTTYSNVVAEKAELESQYDEYREAENTFRTTSISLKSFDKDISRERSRIQTIQGTMTSFLEYQDEIDKLSKHFDALTLIADSLSSTKGIPLYYIKNYLGNVEDTANSMLSIAFGDRIQLDKFRITQSEFAIPFINRGKRLSDVKYASQGELAFISIALSFALSAQTMRDYNILLLDEIDSALDNRYKEKFLGILENQMERMNTEQCFFITHGDMFSSYPVDVIAFTEDQKMSETIPIMT